MKNDTMTAIEVKLYLDIAEVVSRQSSCPRLAVGAVVVQDHRIIAGGYNGAPAGVPHCDEQGCWIYDKAGKPSCFLAVHAELNALLNAGRGGAACKGAWMFCTHMPCVDCLKACVNAGIYKIVYRKAYENELTNRLLSQLPHYYVEHENVF